MIANFESVCSFLQVLRLKELHVNKVVLITEHLGYPLKALNQNSNELLIGEVIQVAHLTIHVSLITL